MRISIPSIPDRPSSASAHIARHAATAHYTVRQAADAVVQFLERARYGSSSSFGSALGFGSGSGAGSGSDAGAKGKGKERTGRTLIMTGAGVSVDSGIRAYRGEEGHYTVNKTYRPIFYHEFVDETERGELARRRYWARSYLGYPPVLRAKPNKTHYAIAALQRLGFSPDIITQNVDSLHHAATPSPSVAASSILELHGTLRNVVCVASPPSYRHPHSHFPNPFPSSSSSTLPPRPSSPSAPKPQNTPTPSAYPRSCGYIGDRVHFQDELTRRNPVWAQLAMRMAEEGVELKMNPDGDVDLAGVEYSTFDVPSCPNCGGIVKPGVIFFGESVPDALRDHSQSLVASSNALLVVGSSLATYSAYRLVKQAAEEGKPVLLLNVGPTRADALADVKLELGSSDVLELVAKTVCGSRADNDQILHRLLNSGVTVPPAKARAYSS